MASYNSIPVSTKSLEAPKSTKSTKYVIAAVAVACLAGAAVATSFKSARLGVQNNCYT